MLLEKARDQNEDSPKSHNKTKQIIFASCQPETFNDNQTQTRSNQAQIPITLPQQTAPAKTPAFFSFYIILFTFQIYKMFFFFRIKIVY
jgi:hypothetical protein